jgi:CNT family concentrative nucleoside transporter
MIRGTMDAFTRFHSATCLPRIGAMLVAFVGLIALVNLALGAASERLAGRALTVQGVVGYAFSPLAPLMGVPWEDAAEVGRLLATKTILNEFLAYRDMQGLIEAGALRPRSVVVSTYALCGFANLGSVAILIGGLGLIDPDRKDLVARLGLKALVSGSLAAFMTACIAGVLAP